MKVQQKGRQKDGYKEMVRKNGKNGMEMEWKELKKKE